VCFSAMAQSHETKLAARTEADSEDPNGVFNETASGSLTGRLCREVDWDGSLCKVQRCGISKGTAEVRLWAVPKRG
jgi:hypothetical protein